MQDFLQIWLYEFSRIEKPQHLGATLSRVAAILGYEFVAYGIRRPLPLSNPPSLTVSNYPARWQERYQGLRLAEIDPVARAANASDRPVVWSSQGNDSDQAFWQEASSFGLMHGWSSATRGAEGTLGVLSLARGGDAIDEVERDRNEFIVHWLANVAHAALAPFLPAAGEPEANLTSRETDVLKWTADGKTAYEISRILSISESTVNFHVKNIMSKLGTSNKIQAVAKAALTGML